MDDDGVPEEGGQQGWRVGAPSATSVLSSLVQCQQELSESGLALGQCSRVCMVGQRFMFTSYYNYQYDYHPAIIASIDSHCYNDNNVIS